MKFLTEHFQNLFELPPEIISDWPLIILAGSKKLYLENHQGLALYQEEIIKVRIVAGYLVIKGQSLKIKEISAENLYISGSFDNFFFDLN